METNRRVFLTISAGAIAFAACNSEALAAPTVDMGEVKDYDKPGIHDKYARSNKLFIVREGDRLYAMSAMCTHRGCVVRKKDDGLLCPCHGSTFEKNGKPTKEPAKAALFRYAISINSENRVIVNRSKVFGEREWEKKEAFVVLPPQ